MGKYNEENRNALYSGCLWSKSKFPCGIIQKLNTIRAIQNNIREKDACSKNYTLNKFCLNESINGNSLHDTVGIFSTISNIYSLQYIVLGFPEIVKKV